MPCAEESFALLFACKFSKLIFYPVVPFVHRSLLLQNLEVVGLDVYVKIYVFVLADLIRLGKEQEMTEVRVNHLKLILIFLFGRFNDAVV